MEMLDNKVLKELPDFGVITDKKKCDDILVPLK